MTVEKQLLYLLSKKSEMTGKAVIEIFEAMDYTPQSIRNTLSKLKRLLYIDVFGRGNYKITVRGLDAYNLYSKKENYYTKHWNGKWYLVILEIPEILRKKRDTFRKGILDLGFGQLYKSVYIYPWNITNKVLNLIDSLEIEEYVTILSSSEILLNGVESEGGSGPKKPKILWDLEKINKDYEFTHVKIENQYKPLVNSLTHDINPDELQIFIMLLSLKDVRDNLITRDPMLPAEFLPGSWLGTSVLFSIEDLIQSLVKLIPESSYYYSFVNDI
ncbi:PaaX family transcriptional regulator C-terminal domain-containing protein [Metabacillus litoralis]|uniref:PaaX family transcriptional regulator C-terminal domain-containing protein n=1 Tax=Metabacillus litoralis TaxID=152268 RepID=UPI000EF5FE06|nr:PaaX family transcriptional regulator C-terminal domain-containing protein [Metabacillus litoralis]